jgi:hypothetical protein
MPRISFLKQIGGDTSYPEVSSDNPLPISQVGSTVSQAPGASIDARAGVAADVPLALPADAARRLLGYMVEEAAAVAAAAEIRLRHGGVAGDLLFPVILAADGVEAQWLGSNGVTTPNGVSIDHVAGTVNVTLFYI